MCYVLCAVMCCAVCQLCCVWAVCCMLCLLCVLCALYLWHGSKKILRLQLMLLKLALDHFLQAHSGSLSSVLVDSN